jgi:hypothetical protein
VNAAINIAWPRPRANGLLLPQCLRIFFERSRFGRQIGIGAAWKGWCFVVLFAGVPAFWLFPPTFIRHVILPMLQIIGAT